MRKADLGCLVVFAILLYNKLLLNLRFPQVYINKLFFLRKLILLTFLYL